MRVLHLSHAFAPEGSGGVESYVEALLRFQRGQGDDARVCCGSLEWRPELACEAEEHDGLPLWRVHRDDLYFDLHSKLYHPGVEALLGELLAEFRPDLIHVHQWIRLTGNLVEIAGRMGIPAVVTLHDLYTSCARAFRVDRQGQSCLRPLSAESCRDCVPRFGHESDRELDESVDLFRDQLAAELAAARRVLVADRATADCLAATTAFDVESCEILPMAYAPRFAGVDLAAAEPAENRPFRFGHWGWLAPHKGLEDLLRGFRLLCDSGPSRSVELHIHGPFVSPEFEAQLRGLAEGLPVEFCGPFRPSELASAGIHAAVFPTRAFETWSFVLDEALELGLPVLLSDLGAPSSRAGDAALRFAPGDPQSLAAAMARLLAEPELRTAMRAAARPSAMSFDEHAERLARIYRQAIEAGAPGDADWIDPLRRARFLQLQRESAQSRICPEGGPR